MASGALASWERNIMYQKILLAVDGSDASKRAVEEAFQLAAFARARVHALYVVSKRGVAPYAGYYDPEALGTVLREDGRIALEAVRAAMSERAIPGGVEIDETQNAADNIPRCLERCVQRQNIDLVVMGTHGRRGASRIVLGSVAEGLLRISTCPVLLVRSPRIETAQVGHGAHG
jgi:nucleotide-binding universal stress UspA family protein